MPRFKIYTASKLSKADAWKALEVSWPEFEFTARWFKFHVGKIPDSESFAKFFWLEDEEDVKRSDAVLVWGEETDVLRGALVEAGMAIASDIPVVVVGKNAGYGTWQYHPLVYRVKTLEEARLMLEMFANAKK